MRVELRSQEEEYREIRYRQDLMKKLQEQKIYKNTTRTENSRKVARIFPEAPKIFHPFPPRPPEG